MPCQFEALFCLAISEDLLCGSHANLLQWHLSSGSVVVHNQDQLGQSRQRHPTSRVTLNYHYLHWPPIMAQHVGGLGPLWQSRVSLPCCQCRIVRQHVSAAGRTSKRARYDHEAEEDEEQAVAEAGDEPSSSSSHIQGSRYSLPGHSLVDLISHGMDLEETADMQPAVMKLLQAVAAKLGSNLHLEDTHSRGSQMVSPNSQPDVTALAVPGSRSWANAVFTGEFKLGDTPPEIAQAIGQEMKRTMYTFEGQVDERTDAVALILTLNSLELLWIRKGENGSIDVHTTGRQSFSVSAASPGFRWLVRLLLTPPHELGFRAAAVPDPQQLGSVAVRELQLIRKGSTHGSGSFVWACKSSMGDAILKLNKMPLEACHLLFLLHLSCV